MYCRNCGKNVEDGLNFCTNCGARVGSASGPAPIRPNTGIPPYKTDRVEPVSIAKRKMRWPLLIVLLLFLVFFSGLTIFAAVKLKGAAGEWEEQVEAAEEEEEVSADKNIEEGLDEEDESLKNIWRSNSSSSSTSATTAAAPETITATTAAALDTTAETPAAEPAVEPIAIAPVMEPSTTAAASEAIDSTAAYSQTGISGFILPGSANSYLTQNDLAGLTQEELRLARNEIYARRGRKFTDAQLQSYFDSCSWYVGIIEPDAFSDSMLNAYEIANRNLIVEYEEEHGYR